VDWYDKRASHLDPRDNWDRTNGRVLTIGVPSPVLISMRWFWEYLTYSRGARLITGAEHAD
jgi:hypothetical protein